MLRTPAPANMNPTRDTFVADGEIAYAGCSLFPGELVRFSRFDESFALVNRTTAFHVLHSGKVTRRAERELGGITISTVGEGDSHTALIALLNEVVGKIAFEYPDKRIRSQF